jgi:hypothetical protein
MIVIDCIARVIDRSVSCIKAVRGVAGALAVIGRIFGGTYLFNRALGG